MKPLKKPLMILGAASVIGLMLAHAQETGTSGTTTRKNAEAISPELAAELKAVEQLPTVEPSTLPYDGRGGTFYSATTLSTYQIPAGTTGFIGPVAGGSGVQIFIPGAPTIPGIQLIDQSSLFSSELKYISSH